MPVLIAHGKSLRNSFPPMRQVLQQNHRSFLHMLWQGLARVLFFLKKNFETLRSNTELQLYKNFHANKSWMCILGKQYFLHYQGRRGMNAFIDTSTTEANMVHTKNKNHQSFSSPSYCDPVCMVSELEKKKFIILTGLSKCVVLFPSTGSHILGY